MFFCFAGIFYHFLLYFGKNRPPNFACDGLTGNLEELHDMLWEQIKEVNTTFPKYKHIKKLITSHDELIKTTTKKVKRNEEMKLIMQEINK